MWLNIIFENNGLISGGILDCVKIIRERVFLLLVRSILYCVLWFFVLVNLVYG